MLDNSQRFQLAGLASTGSRGYSPPNHPNVADLAKHETNGKSDGIAILIEACRVGDRA